MPAMMPSPGPTATGRYEADDRARSRGRRPSWNRLRLGRLLPDREVRADCRCRDPHGEIATDAEEIVLDVRDLPLQGQIGRTLARMEELTPGQRLRHVNTLVPWPLFAMLETRGYRYRLVSHGQGEEAHVLVWPLTRR